MAWPCREFRFIVMKVEDCLSLMNCRYTVFSSYMILISGKDSWFVRKIVPDVE